MSEVQIYTKKRRVRTGCLNCRKIHKKCDEIKPTCSLCKKKTIACIWPSSYGNMKKTKKTTPEQIKNQESKHDFNKENNLNEYTNCSLESYKESSKQASHLDNNNHINRSSDFQRGILPKINNNNNNNGNNSIKSPIEFHRPLADHSHSSIIKDNSLNESTIDRDGSINSLSNSSLSSATITHRPGSVYSFELPNLAEPQSPRVLLSNILNERSPEANNKLIKNQDSNVLPGQNIITNSSNEIKLSSRNEVIENSFEYNYNEGISDDMMGGDSNIKSLSSENFGFSEVYSDLHNTFRDYMFTNAELNDLPINITFKNILNSPTPSLFNESQKNLKNLLNTDTQYDSFYGKNRILCDQKNAERNIIETKLSIDQEEELQLFKNYLYEVAPWLDMYDKTRKFGTDVAEYAYDNKSLRYAIYAISSKQMEQIDRNYNPDKTKSLYQESLKFLMPTVNKIMNKATISTCVILCAFEMMFSASKFWRHHCEGCHALFKANEINGFSEPLERSLFWCYARMDVNSTIIGEQQTLIPSESWLPKNSSIYDSKKLFTETKNEDMYANYIVFLNSRVLNLISSHVSNYEKEWLFLWKEVKDWIEERPLQFKPVLEFDGDPFPSVLYLNGPAGSANQLYHMAIILLIQNKPRLLKVERSKYIKSTIWHAKQICAISINNNHLDCCTNALQPLWIAGKLLSSDLEHKIIVDILNKIESTTGWQMGLRIRDLKKYWSGNMTV